MLTLENNQLVVRFPEIHPDAVCTIEFQRTLRIPDDNRTHKLPPGLGRFPLSHVDDFAHKLPAAWHKRGGVFMPMHQAEAMWIRFHSRYPFAVKIAAGKINAVTGDTWTPELKGPVFRAPYRDVREEAKRHHPTVFGGLGSVWGGVLPPEEYSLQAPLGVPRPQLVKSGPDQDYLAVPKQPWLDGFSVGKGKIRQFVAMPLGDGYTVEEQLTGEAVHGGLQIIIYPLKPEFYRPKPVMRSALNSMSGGFFALCASAGSFSGAAAQSDMGLAPGGLMEQTIHETEFSLEQWDQTKSAKCFVHLLNSAQYKHVTGNEPPHPAPTAEDYTRAGYPWFEEYAPFAKQVPGSSKLQMLDSVANMANKLGENPLKDNAPLSNPPKVTVVKHPNEVRNGEF